MSTSILECKLKRHKISYSNENGKIIIGKPKIDYGTLIGLIAFPIIAGIGISLLMILNNIEFIGAKKKGLLPQKKNLCYSFRLKNKNWVIFFGNVFN